MVVREPPSLAIRDQTVEEPDECEDTRHRWSNLSQAVQGRMAQDWVTREWTDLKGFCYVHGLEYRSIKIAFTRRKILERDSFKITNGDVNKAAGEWVYANSALAKHTITAIERLGYELVTDEDMSVAQLLLILERLTTEGAKVAYTIGALKAAQNNGVELSGNGLSAQGQLTIPADVAKALNRQLSIAGETAVKHLEMEDMSDE